MTASCGANIGRRVATATDRGAIFTDGGPARTSGTTPVSQHTHLQPCGQQSSLRSWSVSQQDSDSVASSEQGWAARTGSNLHESSGHESPATGIAGIMSPTTISSTGMRQRMVFMVLDRV